MLSINPNLKFSYNLIKGSSKDRSKMVSNLNVKLFNALRESMGNYKGKTSDIKPIFDSVCPEKKLLKIFKLESTDTGNVGNAYYLEDKHGQYIGQGFDFYDKNGKFGPKELVTIMHELTHILLTLTNPKHTAREIKIKRNFMETSLYNNWYLSTINNSADNILTKKGKEDYLSEVKQKTYKFLKGMSNQKKLDYIQNSRYELEQEHLAYKEQLKFAKIMHKQKKELYKGDLDDENKLMLIPEKLNLLKQIGFETIADMRLNIAKHLKKNNCI